MMPCSSSRSASPASLTKPVTSSISADTHSKWMNSMVTMRDLSWPKSNWLHLTSLSTDLPGSARKSRAMHVITILPWPETRTKTGKTARTRGQSSVQNKDRCPNCEITIWTPVYIICESCRPAEPEILHHTAFRHCRSSWSRFRNINDTTLGSKEHSCD